MRRYMVVGLGLVLGVSVAWAAATATQSSTTRAALNLEDAAKRLTEATGVTWRVSKREREPGLGVELSSGVSAWHGVAVPYFVLPFGLDEHGKAKLEFFRQNRSFVLDVIASDDRCVVLAGPSREPDVTAKVLAVLGLPESTEAEQSRLVYARAEWLDFRLAVAKPSGAKGDLPIPLVNGPTVAQIKDYQELFAAKGPNGGRHRGDPFLWFWRLGFCEPPPLLVITEDQYKAQYVLLSNRPEDVLLSGSARPRPWHLNRVYATTDAHGRPAVGIEFDETAAKQMGTLTGANVGRPLAILFHGNVLSVLTVEAKITDKLLISGAKFDKPLVDKIVRSLSECMLAENETVSPAAHPATQPETVPANTSVLVRLKGIAALTRTLAGNAAARDPKGKYPTRDELLKLQKARSWDRLLGGGTQRNAAWPALTDAPELRELLLSDDPAIRSLAVEALGSLKQPEDVERIACLIDDTATALPRLLGVHARGEPGEPRGPDSPAKAWAWYEPLTVGRYAAEAVAGMTNAPVLGSSKAFSKWWQQNRPATTQPATQPGD